MPKRVRDRNWQTGFPPEFTIIAKSVAMATLPAVEGPYPEDEAQTLRRSFYAYRDALRASVEAASEQGQTSNSNLVSLSTILDKLSVKIKPISESPNEYNVIFDLHPLVKAANRIDPAAAQASQLYHAHFVAAQRLPSLSTSMFSDEEMQERLDDISKGQS